VKVSKCFDEFRKERILDAFFLKYDNQPIILPDKFPPKKEFLDFHYEVIFKK
jgi:putative restriction endonuclease